MSTALLGSAFIYLDHWGFCALWLNTVLGISFLYLLLSSNRSVWLITGFFLGIFWFWWIALSFKHYHMPWAIPIVIIVVGSVYGLIFWLMAYFAEKIPSRMHFSTSHASSREHLTLRSDKLVTLSLKALALLILSYVHPFGFDWFKPELVFVESYLGIEKWQFALILAGMVLSLWRKEYLYMLLVLFAWQAPAAAQPQLPENIRIVTTHTGVEEKWDKSRQPAQFRMFFSAIDKAIDENKSLVILPESVFPVYLKHSAPLLRSLQERSKKIAIVAGGLYWDGKTPRNSTYIFTDKHLQIANKVLLVPFGESNPLPDFLSDWVNKVFYDGAVDYKADSNVTDYTINGTRYRNAICFEATSEKLYEGNPRHMIALSNNGWFTPSIEPTLQKLLLQYYSRKYGTTIYHSINMAESYIVQNAKARSTP